MISISLDYNLEEQVERYQYIANTIRLGFYQSQRFYILPYLSKTFKYRVVHFPVIKKYNEKFKEYCAYDHHKSLPNCISEIIRDGLEEIALNFRKDILLFENKLNKDLKDFEKTINNALDYKNDITVVVNPTILGTKGSYNPYKSEVLQIFPRIDLGVDNVYRVIIQGLAHLLINNIDSQMNQEMVEKVSDKALGIAKEDDIKPFLKKSKNIIHVLEENTCGNLVKDSINYCCELGFPVVSLIGSTSQFNNLRNEEKIILKLLIENRNQIVTFSEISDALWKENSSEKFSMYAIAKVVERLREKIKEFGISVNVIHTQRGQGYVLYD